jgi:alcohol dehydrogenase class IV
MEQKESIGPGAIRDLQGILTTLSPSRIFLVTGRSSYDVSGARSLLEPMLAGYEHTRFCDFSANPEIGDIERGVGRLRASAADLVMAVGGGSVIDMAKSLSLLADQPLEPRTYVLGREKMEAAGRPLIAIPTTAGSGSEATRFAVVYVDRSKYSLEHESMLPAFAVVDPDLTKSLPAAIAAATGMDALCQAVESYWNVNSTGESKKYAAEAIELAMGNLEKAVNAPSPGARESMARAAHLAGKAINISKTSACHAISYPITSYFGVPHGHAAGLTLPPMLVFNSRVTGEDLQDRRGLAYVRCTMEDLVSLIGARGFEQAGDSLTGLMERIHLETRLGALGIDEEGISVIVANGFNPDRVGNNPRLLTEEALRSMLARIA